jgi:DNA-directed RNA polymerase subunit RPC12/RpoP
LGFCEKIPIRFPSGAPGRDVSAFFILPAVLPVYLKISCSHCGGHIEFASQNVGQQIPCPHCRKSIALRKPDFLKMACFFCKEHIEFPAHAIGEKMPCPHCKMDITLKEPA